MKDIKYLNDEFTLQIDDLGYKKQIDIIRDVVINADTPFTIGISGRWGSGKTSIMKYLMASLGGEPMEHNLDFHNKTTKNREKYQKVFNIYEDEEKQQDRKDILQTIWFNPWENEKRDEPLVALLQLMYNHFSYIRSQLDEAKKDISISIEAGLSMIADLLKITKVSTIKKIAKDYEYDNFQYSDRSQKFKLLFENAISKLIPIGLEEDSRIVIFVDDLDRCEEQTIAKLLKEIKQYLSTKRCVFVFGYDRHHIEKSLSKVETKTSKETKAYLEKLFQTTFYIKQPKKDDLNKYIIKLLDNYKIDNSMTKFISEIIEPNPRRLKTFITSFYFYIQSYEIKNEGDLERLALMAYLKIFYESVYTVLEHDISLKDTLITTFTNQDPFDIKNEKDYYFRLEFKNHLKEGIDNDFRDKIDYGDKGFEEKFLSEVYEMQGKHKNFEEFTRKFTLYFREISIENYI